MTGSGDDLDLVFVGQQARIAIPDLAAAPAGGGMETEEVAGPLEMPPGPGPEPAAAARDVEGSCVGHGQVTIEPGQQIPETAASLFGRKAGAKAVEKPEQPAALVAAALLVGQHEAKVHGRFRGKDGGDRRGQGGSTARSPPWGESTSVRGDRTSRRARPRLGAAGRLGSPKNKKPPRPGRAPGASSPCVRGQLRYASCFDSRIHPLEPAKEVEVRFFGRRRIFPRTPARLAGYRRQNENHARAFGFDRPALGPPTVSGGPEEAILGLFCFTATLMGCGVPGGAPVGPPGDARFRLPGNTIKGANVRRDRSSYLQETRWPNPRAKAK